MPAPLGKCTGSTDEQGNSGVKLKTCQSGGGSLVAKFVSLRGSGVLSPAGIRGQTRF